LVFIKSVVYKKFSAKKWYKNGVGKEKKLYAKKWYKKGLV
jgi:hypothetical protein